MHDPLVMAFRVHVPRLWPRRATWHRTGWARWRYTLLTVWHRDPSGYDTGTCGYRNLWKHPHHWRIQVHPWQDFRHRWLDRCAWCGKGSGKHDRVNHAMGWDAEAKHWWRHTHAFHRECIAVYQAHRMCTCPPEEATQDPRPGVHDCWNCGRFLRDFRMEKDATERAANRILQTIPHGQRDPEKSAQATQLWVEYHRQEFTP